VPNSAKELEDQAQIEVEGKNQNKVNHTFFLLLLFLISELDSKEC
jgi:hypothetical protein